MAALTDPGRLRAYRDAVRNWNVAGYIRFQLTETAYRWIKRELDNASLKEIGRLMHEHVEGGGVIDEVRETRPEWAGEYPFHYDLRLKIQDQAVYLETRLHHREPFIADDSWILVVSIHTP